MRKEVLSRLPMEEMAICGHEMQIRVHEGTIVDMRLTSKRNVAEYSCDLFPMGFEEEEVDHYFPRIF
jgi:hypothetical protein